MIDQTHLERLAAMGHALRPDWPVKSLLTFLRTMESRPYRDVAVALAWVAADPKTKTPRRLAEAGPWWHAAAVESVEGFERFRVRCPDHPGRKAGTCPDCAAARTQPRPEVLAEMRAVLAATPRPQRADITHPKKAPK